MILLICHKNILTINYPEDQQELQRPLYGLKVLDRTALRYRLYLPVQGLMGGKVCCCNTNTTIDMWGHHLAHGCNVGGYNNYIHDGVKICLHSIIKRSCKWTKLEEHNLFDNTRKRADITIHNFNGTNHRVLLDVAATTTMHFTRAGELNLAPNAVNSGQASTNMYNHKLHTYANICDAGGFGFLPKIFDTNGYVHAEVLGLLKG